MKALCYLAALSAALFLASCSLTQQQVKDAPAGPPEAKTTKEAPPAPPEQGNKTPAAAEAAATGETAQDAAPAPTAEQQEAARQLLAEQANSAPIPEPAAATQDEAATLPTGSTAPPSGSLRMGRIAPLEEAASTAAGAAPGTNSAELRGLRSPKLPSGLPMNIHGKLNSQR